MNTPTQHHSISSILVALLAVAAAGCGDDKAEDTTLADTTVVFDTTADSTPTADTIADSVTIVDTASADTVGTDTAADTVDTDTAMADSVVVDSIIPSDTSTPSDVIVTRRHYRLTFADEFRGKEGLPSDDYCFDQLKPQCHIWPGESRDCDLADQPTELFPPTKANMVAALRLFDTSTDFEAMSAPDVKAAYGLRISQRMAHLNKCNWTLYTMVNWMATDYQGRWAARFDASQVRVDPAGKGYLELTATHAPVEANCIYGGIGGDPNCQVHSFQAGQLTPGVSYWVDPNPAWPGVYYAPVGGACPHGGTLTGDNCNVISFPPHFLEETGVSYWADADPNWPGVYYANQTYRCKSNIDYSPALGFRNLTCPVLNGGVMSFPFTNKPWVDPDGTEHGRGFLQHQGRFEAKARIPKGIGAFPATWLMPESGGWPYDGGEIDVMEARDNANEVYQTYHHGKCYLAATGAEMAATDSTDCATKGGVTTHLSKGFTTGERETGEFWQRDHLFAVEWSEDRFDYFINDVLIGTIEVGSQGRISEGAPAALAAFKTTNFPARGFYWILNHSTYVPDDALATFVQQLLRIDYVRNYAACGTDHAEYCPSGGTFQEGVGCTTADGDRYESPCRPSIRKCVNGGTAEGARCRVHSFAPDQLVGAVDYWVDSDPRWPGVYYAQINGGCPHGGSGSVNCQLVSLAADRLETGIHYAIDLSASPPGIFYSPDFDD